MKFNGRAAKVVSTGLFLCGIGFALWRYPLGVCVTSLLVVGYVYALYPLALFWMRKRPTASAASTEYSPSVSVIVAAFNEEESIVRRIRNILLSAYPPERIEILIGSDGSSDRTVERALSLNEPRVRVLDFSANRGRASVHNDCAAAATGEILVFSDAETEFTPEFLRRIIRPFADPRVGLSTGVMDLVNGDENGLTVSRGWYWRFEYALRKWETGTDLLAVASGCCMAVRKTLYRPLPEPTDDIDFICPLDVAALGFRNVHANKAVVYERQFAGVRGEFRSRVRMTSRNLYGTWRHLQSYPVHRHPRLWLSVISHKLLRWMTPFFLIAAYLSTWPSSSSGFMEAAFWGQSACYGAAVLGALLKQAGFELRYLSSFHSFVVANAGFFVGALNGLYGVRPRTYSRHKESA